MNEMVRATWCGWTVLAVKKIPRGMRWADYTHYITIDRGAGQTSKIPASLREVEVRCG